MTDKTINLPPEIEEKITPDVPTFTIQRQADGYWAVGRRVPPRDEIKVIATFEDADDAVWHVIRSSRLESLAFGAGCIVCLESK